MILRTVNPAVFSTGQGDVEILSAILLDNSTAVDLTGASITFVMKNDIGTIRHSIDCGEGSANGGISIPLTAIETGTPGTFFGQVIVNFPGDGSDNYFGSDYLSSAYFGSYFGAGSNVGGSGRHTFPNDEYTSIRVLEAA